MFDLDLTRLLEKWENKGQGNVVAELTPIVAQYGIENVLTRTMTHFAAYEKRQKVIVNKESLNPIPGEILDTLLEVVTGEEQQKLVVEIVKWYTGDEYAATEQLSREVTSFLVSKMGTFSANPLMVQLMVYFCDEIVEIITGNIFAKARIFEILGYALDTLQVTGKTEYVHEKLRGIIEHDVCWSHVLPLANMFKRLKLTSDLLEASVWFFIRLLSTAPDDEKPLLMFQVLVMIPKIESTTKKRSCLGKLLLGDDNYEREANLLVHMSMAISQDVSLATDLLAFIKASRRVYLSPFIIALALGMGKNKKFKDIYLFISKELGVMIKAKRTQELSEWIDSLIERTKYNWEILEGLIELGITMLEYNVGNAFFVPPSRSNMISGLSLEPSRSLPPLSVDGNSTCSLGARILFQLFEMHEMVRETVLDAIVDRIAAKSNGTHLFIAFLRLFAQKPALVYGYNLYPLLDQIQHMTKHLAHNLMTTLASLSLWNVSFRDTIMLYLRKGANDKREIVSETCVRGAVELYRLCISNQVGQTFVFEVMRLLRSYLMLSGHLKNIMYAEMCASNCNFQDIVAPHLLSYIVNSEFDIERCISESRVDEPLPRLIKVCANSNDVELISAVGRVASTYASKTLDDFVPDHVFKCMTPEYVKAVFVVVIYEALIEFVSLTSQSPTLINSLDEKFYDFSEIIRAGYLTTKDKKSAHAKLHSDHCLISVVTLAKIAPIIEVPRDSLIMPRIQSSLAAFEYGEVKNIDTAILVARLILTNTLSKQFIERQSSSKQKNLCYAADTLFSVFSVVNAFPWFETFLASVVPENSGVLSYFWEIFQNLVLYKVFKEAYWMGKVLELLLGRYEGSVLSSPLFNMARANYSVDDPNLVKIIVTLLISSSKNLGILTLLARNILKQCGHVNVLEEPEDLELAENETLFIVACHQKKHSSRSSNCM